MPMLETESYLLNPGRKSRKARRRRGKARRSNKRGWFAKRGRYRGGKKRRFRGGVRYTRPKRSTVRSRRRGRRRKARRSNPHYNVPARRRRGGGRRRSNAGIAGVSLAFPADVLPFRLPIPGIPGEIANGVLQGVAAGAVVIGGYMISGALVNFIVSPAKADDAASKGENFVGKWARPLLFAATAGIIGSVVAMIAPKGRKATFGLLAAAGPGLRALGGFVKAIMDPPKEAGFMQDVYNLSVGLSDYLQVGQENGEGMEDIYEAGMGNEADEEMADYLQVEDIYEAGMGEEVGAEEEVVGI